MGDKRAERLLFLLSSVFLILLAFAACRKKPQVTKVAAEILERDELEEIKKSREEYTEETALGKLYYQGVRLPYSEYNQTLYLTVMEGQNLKLEEFLVEGSEDAQLTIGLQDDTEYDVKINGEDAGRMCTNLGGKLSLSVELAGVGEVKVEISR